MMWRLRLIAREGAVNRFRESNDTSPEVRFRDMMRRDYAEMDGMLKGLGMHFGPENPVSKKKKKKKKVGRV
jgi:hypothetical protein